MNYATAYHIGRSKERTGINEDSVAATVFEDGHREGYTPFDGDDDPAPDGEERADDEDGSDREDGSDDDGGRTRSNGVFVLADGAGGHDSGDVASYIATTVVSRELTPLLYDHADRHPEEFALSTLPTTDDETLSTAELQDAVADAIVEAHREVLRYATAESARAYTTVVAGIKLGDHLHYGWVGDSRAYVCNRAHGHLSQLTRDHSPVARQAERGEIDAVEAMVHPDGNVLNRALGGGPHDNPDAATVEVDTASIPLYAADTLLFTSDGLIDAQTDYERLYHEYVRAGRDDEAAAAVRERVVTDDLIEEVLLEASDVDRAASRLIEIANDRGGKDNVSLVLIEDDGLPETPRPEESPTRSHPPLVPLEERRTLVQEAAAGDGAASVAAPDTDSEDTEHDDSDTTAPSHDELAAEDGSDR